MLSFQMYIQLSYYFYAQYYYSSDILNKYQDPCTHSQENLGLFSTGDGQMSIDCGFFKQRRRWGSNFNSIHFLLAIVEPQSININKSLHKRKAYKWWFVMNIFLESFIQLEHNED